MNPTFNEQESMNQQKLSAFETRANLWVKKKEIKCEVFKIDLICIFPFLKNCFQVYLYTHVHIFIQKYIIGTSLTKREMFILYYTTQNLSLTFEWTSPF